MFKNWGKINAENWSWIFIFSILAGSIGIVICDFFSFLLFHVHTDVSLVVVFVLFIVCAFCGFILSVTLFLANIRLFEEENPTIDEFQEIYPKLFHQIDVRYPKVFKHHCIECGREMRVTTRFTILSYDPDTGRPNRTEMQVFCMNKDYTGHRHKRYSIILDGDDNPV